MNNPFSIYTIVEMGKKKKKKQRGEKDRQKRSDLVLVEKNFP